VLARLTLVINSDLADVSLVAVAINKSCLYLGLDEVRAGEVELCIVEAVTNVIRHSYHGESGHAVSVAIATSVGRLHFYVLDNGTSMKSDAVEKLVHGVSVKESGQMTSATLSEGGRGLQIIHELMDEVAYTQDGRQNCLTLVKQIGSSDSAQSRG
jgi:serine/threonine-protein kinase RsbW